VVDGRARYGFVFFRNATTVRFNQIYLGKNDIFVARKYLA